MTKPPDSITDLAWTPISVPAATAARSMSPVESCGMPISATIFGACEPFPDPGGPKRIMMSFFPLGGVIGRPSEWMRVCSWSIQYGQVIAPRGGRGECEKATGARASE